MPNSSIIITGSLAYDTIMVFPDEFRKHILPDKMHLLNVCFNVTSLHRHFGGNAGNIAYNLSLLGRHPEIVATVGNDFEPYRNHLEKLGIVTKTIKILEDERTAQAFITTDLKDNQISVFFEGALARASEQPLSVLSETPGLVHIGPNFSQTMLEHAKHCQKNSWKYFFDPGQALNALSGEQIREALQGAQGLFVNDYEWELLKLKAALTTEEVLKFIPRVLVTLADQGVEVILPDRSFRVPAVPSIKVVDPTGAGDAFRAGFLYGISQDFSLEDCCRWGNAVASFAIESSGTQEHRFSFEGVLETIKTIE